MPAARDFIFGPWRAVSVLGVTQIIAWGALIYPPVLIMPLIAEDRGWSRAFAMSGFSFGLLIAGFVAPFVGASIDRHGGHAVMPFGSLAGALGLVALTYADHPFAYLAVWMVLGAAMAASLYDPAFATLGRIFGAGARKPITMLTLAGGFASTVSWPLTQFVIGQAGWRGAYLMHAALLAFVAAPLHAFALPRDHAVVDAPPVGVTAKPTALLPSHGLPFLLVIAAFASYAFVPSGLSAHLLAIFGRAGIDASTVVLVGALFGPSQVFARICEFMFAGSLHPLIIARSAVGLLVAAFVLLAMFGISVPVAIAFAMMFGAANGLITIARGAVPLALFGPAGYGRVIGRIARPSLILQAAAPLVLALAAERWSDAGALTLAAIVTLAALACFLAIRRPN